MGLFTAEPGLDAFGAKHGIVMERRPLRSGARVLKFVTVRRPTHAGSDPCDDHIDRNSRDDVLRLGDPDQVRRRIAIPRKTTYADN